MIYGLNLTKKEERRLISISNGSFKKEPEPEELYSLLKHADHDLRAIVLHNIIIRLNSTKPTPPRRGRPKN